MKFTSITCPNCGGALTERNGIFSCTFCFTEFRENQLSAQEVFLKTLDAAKQEALASARRMLYDAVHAEDVSSERVIEGARGVKKYAPDDFSANFYEAACDSDARTVNNFLNGVDVAKQSKFLLTGVCEFMLRSLEKRNIGPLKDFLERAHLAGVFTGGEYTDYLTRTEKEAEKLDNGVYNADLPRDVFLAYSSRDMAEVNALADYLEGEGLRCFVAARNLRHGKGAAENYRRLLETAMRNCKSVVFVSTEHSRDLGCDALAVELPYLREHRGDIYRVEYRPASDSGRTTTGAKILLEAFFEDLEYARTREDVLARLIKHKYGLDKAASSKEAEKQKEEEAAIKRAEEEARNRELAEMREEIAQMERERRKEEARMARMDEMREELAQMERERATTASRRSQKSESEYDCFLCVKVTDGHGGVTEDSEDADDIYEFLRDIGYKPFYAERELRNVTGADYEARILYALSTSKCMLVICRDEEYLKSPWLKNEYTRFLELVDTGKKETDSVAIVFWQKPIERLPGNNRKLRGIDLSRADVFHRIGNFVKSHCS